MRTSRTDPVNAARTGGAHSGPATSGQWWKAWILLASLGATVGGWMALPGVKSPPERVVLSPKATLPRAEVVALPIRAVEEPRRPSSSLGSMPTMPQKPVFQAPVTRTRRS